MGSFLRGKNKIIFEDYYCPDCDTVHSVIRSLDRRRGKHHLKKIYCYKCDKEINHIKV